VLYISSELEEVLILGDRIGVIYNGKLSGIVSRSEADITRIGLLMAGVEEAAA
jgi:general nucleoside transport system ATP-binding protein